MKTSTLSIFCFLIFWCCYPANTQTLKTMTCAHSHTTATLNKTNSNSNSAIKSSLQSENCTEGYDPENIKIVRVNVHFLLTEDVNNPGNFTEVDDGRGNSNYNGYQYAEEMVHTANYFWERNFTMTLYYPRYPNPAPEVLPKGIQLILNGVYFHRYDEHYYSYLHPLGPCNSIIDLVGVHGSDLGESINVFVVEDTRTLDDNGNPDCETRGVACIDAANAAVTLENLWCKYPSAEFVDNTARLLNHEIGHVFGLDHSFECTPQCPELDPAMEYNGDPTSSCGTGNRNLWESGSNNIMGYNPFSHAFSPCQIGIIHETLDGSHSNYVQDCTPVCETSATICCVNDNHPNGISGIITEPCCVPPNAYFSQTETLWACVNNDDYSIVLNAQASWNETAYKIQIIKYQPNGNNQWYNGPWIDGEAGLINLTQLSPQPNFLIEPGFDYWIKLVVKNECDEWEDHVETFSIEYTPKPCSELCAPMIIKQAELCALDPSFEQISNIYQLTFPIDETCTTALESIESICWNINGNTGYFDGNQTEICGEDLFEVSVTSTGQSGELELIIFIQYWTANGLQERKVTYTETILDCCQPEIVHDGALCALDGSDEINSSILSLQFNLPEEECFSRLGRICWSIESGNAYFLVNGVPSSFVCSPHPDEVDAFRSVELFIINDAEPLEVRAEVYFWDLNGAIKTWLDIRFTEDFENCCKPVLNKRGDQPLCLSEHQPELSSAIFELLWPANADCGPANILDICWEVNEEVAYFTNATSPSCSADLLEMQVNLNGQTGTLNLLVTITYLKADGSIGTWTLEWMQEILHCVSPQLYGSRHSVPLDQAATLIRATDFPVHIFPNPTRDRIHIQVKQFDHTPFELHYELLHITQKMVRRGTLNRSKTSLDLSGLDSGIYLLILRSPNSQIMQTHKIIKH